MLFAYTRSRNTEYTILTVVHPVLKHLEKPKTFSRLLFLDLSPAFNAIQPHLLMRELVDMDFKQLIEFRSCVNVGVAVLGFRP